MLQTAVILRTFWLRHHNVLANNRKVRCRKLHCRIYRNDLKTFEAELKQPALKIARRRIPVSIGILTGSWRQPIAFFQIQQQVQTVRKQGFVGVSFFYWETLSGYITSESPQSRRNAFQALFNTGARG